ncbi:hypothetical protein [Streptomyces sp. NPDC058548]|uniref:hypothetical protein n=1 Tax=Streptomyces sp. NPDC058548 TaxID=3346545 RepID=UPI00364BA1D1
MKETSDDTGVTHNVATGPRSFGRDIRAIGLDTSIRLTTLLLMIIQLYRGRGA